MAKIRKCKLSWEASASEQVVGYKLYWSKGTAVDYNSRSIKIGNVTEITLPDDVTLADGPVMFGVTAIDRDGNESDMITIEKPYQLQVPEAPVGLAIRPSEEFRLTGTGQPANGNAQLVAAAFQESAEDEDSLARAIEDGGTAQVTPMKTYPDIENRRTT